MKEGKFWSTQRSMRLDDEINNIGIIDNPPSSDFPSEPSKLPSGYEWANIDPSEIKEFISIHYKSQEDGRTDPQYTEEFLNLALKGPNYNSDWHCGIKASGNIVAFISATPMKIGVTHKDHNEVLDAADINFLCCDKRLRDKRLAPVLITEITRRIARTGMRYATYTRSEVHTKTVGSGKYYHRLLKNIPNPKINYRLMQPKDISHVTQLLSNYMSKCKIRRIFSNEEVKHLFLNDVVHSYVLVNDNDEPTDFASWYEFKVRDKLTGKDVDSCYLFYHASHRMHDMLRVMMFDAMNKNYNIFNSLNVMGMHDVLLRNKFVTDENTLHYYIFNYRFPNVNTSNIGCYTL